MSDKAQTKATILLVEDEAEFRQRMHKVFGQDYHFLNTHSIKGAMQSLQNLPCDLILLDLTLENGVELEALNHIGTIKKYNTDLPLIVVTKDQLTQTVVDAMKKGANDFVRKNEFNAEVWREKFDDHISRFRKSAGKKTKSIKIAKGEGSTSDIFIGDSSQIKEIKDKLRKLSEFPDVTVLITGETGVGKEVAAKYLHLHGQRKNKPFKAVNLSAVSKNLMESELFGHKKGAFTHAIADQDGAFLQANGGVLLLDEIGEIDHNIQVKLLRFLETKVITPVGGKEIQLDLQIVAATNRDIPTAIAEGMFREDLYYRLNQYEIKIPPLRERLDDLELLISHYLKAMNEEPGVLSIDVRKRLLQYSWPGNVRELVNIMKKLVVDKVMTSRKKITEDLLPDNILHPKMAAKSTALGNADHMEFGDHAHVAENQLVVAELQRIEAALNKHIKKSDAAKELGWGLDKLKYNIVDRYYAHFPDLVRRFPTICSKYKRFIK
ncbi:MAG: sigma-54 dependent transcriptional regulator [Saprospiraceae bacterium]|nr:sigma-54-dependent Fis family transcriptional regulator [Lewinella sp.]